jgi:hypothetical protein
MFRPDPRLAGSEVGRMSYEHFLFSKSHDNTMSGFKPNFMPDFLYPHQAALVDWSVNKGKSAIFIDCGMGKTPISLVWAENVARKTKGRVLILTPLAVSMQFEDEGRKFDIPVVRSSGELPDSGIVVTNYEKLDKFRPSDFAGVVCDESSILKNYSGSRKGEITDFMKKIKYRLLDTATAAPNDYHELGTSSEALGYLGYMDMLNRFFKNDLNNSASGRMRGEVIKWRLKGHAEQPFWRWVCSWARAARKPSDLGFDNGDFDLPPLTEECHPVHVKTLADGMLFDLPAHGLKEQREERRRSITERCEKMAEIINSTKRPALAWCHLNDEGDLLEHLIPDCVQVSGKDSDDAKEEKLMGFQKGKYRVLVTKPKIGAWGLNFQHCNHVLTFPSHSFEQYYQSIRRCWRFGQKNPVHVDIITTEGEQDVLKNLQRKAKQANEMFSNLVQEMNKELSIERINRHTKTTGIPQWL